MVFLSVQSQFRNIRYPPTMTVNILNSHFSPPVFCCLNVDCIFSVYFARTALYLYKFSDHETFFFCQVQSWRLLQKIQRAHNLSTQQLVAVLLFKTSCLQYAFPDHTDQFLLNMFFYVACPVTYSFGSGQTLSLRDIPGPFILTCIMVQRLNSYPYLVNSSFQRKVQLMITLREAIFDSCVIIETALVLGLQQNMKSFCIGFFFSSHLFFCIQA